MDYFGINSPADLPKIREVLAEQLVQPTVINPNNFITEIEEPTDESLLTVNSNGDLIIPAESIDETSGEKRETGETNNEESSNESENPPE